MTNNPAVNSRLGNVIADNFNLSLYNVALNYTGVISELNSSQTLTVLAPNDASFMSAGYLDAVAIKGANKELLTMVIQYHVLQGKYNFNTLPFLFNQEVNTIGGLKIYATRWIKGADTVLTLNGSQIISKNLPGSNGLIQVINAVLTPPTYPLLTQAIANNDSLTFFNQALIRANLTTILQGTGTYTVFAPSNGAFNALGYATIDSINKTSPAVLKALMNYQILQGRKFIYDYVLSSDSTNTSQQAMFDGNNVTIDLIQDYNTGKYTGITINGIGNSQPATIIQGNILTGNGVVHVINQVLKPNF